MRPLLLRPALQTPQPQPYIYGLIQLAAATMALTRPLTASPPGLPLGRPGGRTREARPEDLDRLLELENRCFSHDRLSRRSFRHFLISRTAVCLVAEEGGALLGYALVLLHGRTSLARLYSMAVAPEAQAQGQGARLLSAAEAAALERGAAIMRLEVKPDNTSAIALYRRAGYQEFGIYRGFYEDASDALRMERALVPPQQPIISRVPHYLQTLEFTCGPAALMMAMHGLDPAVPLDRQLELRLWRESTMIFMTSGHGGCGPHGLALAAARRGFEVELYVSDDLPPFLESVRDPEKREVIRLVHQDFLAELRETDIALHPRPLDVGELTEKFASGAMVIVLISHYRIYGDKVPHWIIMSGFDQSFVYVHDPYIGNRSHGSSTDCVSIPVLRREFELMARYGRSRLRAAIVLQRRR
jgi:ribosomal-protein-alanine acetyltransferase